MLGIVDGQATASARIDDHTNEAKDAVDADTEDVAEADLPEEITSFAAGMPELGAFEKAEKMGDSVVAEYENGMVAFNPETGAQPLVGRIAETWEEDGGLNNKVGLPTAPEMKVEGGWTQAFQHGTIEWKEGLGDTDGTYGKNYVEGHN